MKCFKIINIIRIDKIYYPHTHIHIHIHTCTLLEFHELSHFMVMDCSLAVHDHIQWIWLTILISTTILNTITALHVINTVIPCFNLTREISVLAEYIMELSISGSLICKYIASYITFSGVL